MYRVNSCMMVVYGVIGLLMLAGVGLVAYALFGVPGALHPR